MPAYRDDSAPTLLTLRVRRPPWITWTAVLMGALAIGQVVHALGHTPGPAWTVASIAGAVVPALLCVGLVWMSRRLSGRLIVRPSSLRLVRAGRSDVYPLSGARLERKRIESGEVGLLLTTTDGDVWITRGMVGSGNLDALEGQLVAIL